jgi:hypothetical protein
MQERSRQVVENKSAWRIGQTNQMTGSQIQKQKCLALATSWMRIPGGGSCAADLPQTKPECIRKQRSNENVITIKDSQDLSPNCPLGSGAPARGASVRSSGEMPAAPSRRCADLYLTFAVIGTRSRKKPVSRHQTSPGWEEWAREAADRGDGYRKPQATVHRPTASPPRRVLSKAVESLRVPRSPGCGAGYRTPEPYGDQRRAP